MNGASDQSSLPEKSVSSREFSYIDYGGSKRTFMVYGDEFIAWAETVISLNDGTGLIKEGYNRSVFSTSEDRTGWSLTRIFGQASEDGNIVFLV